MKHESRREFNIFLFPCHTEYANILSIIKTQGYNCQNFEKVVLNALYNFVLFHLADHPI